MHLLAELAEKQRPEHARDRKLDVVDLVLGNRPKPDAIEAELLAEPRHVLRIAREPVQRLRYDRRPSPGRRRSCFPLARGSRSGLGSVDDFATGEGLTIHFAVAAARSEGEFRRRLATEMGAGLADRARVGCGIDACVPFLPLFVTPALRAALAAFETDNGPATFSFFAHHHANYS